MKLQLNTILKNPKINNYKVLTGEHTLQKKITGITIMDIDDISNWLNPEEVLIIGKFFLEGIITKQFLLKLHKKKCSGIITKTKFEKYISDDLIIYARNLGLPIIVFSDNYSWNDIMSPINLEIVRSQNRELKLADQYNYIMINSVFKNNSFKGICNHVTSVLAFPIALVNKDFKIIDSSDNLDWKKVVESINIKENSRIYLSEEFNSTEVATYNLPSPSYNDSELLSYSLESDNVLVSKLLVYVPINYNIRNISFHLKVENFLHVVAIKEEVYQQSFDRFLWHEEILLNNLLNYSNETDQSKNDIEFSTGKTIKEKYYVVVIKNDAIFKEESSLYYYAKNEKFTKPYFKDLLLFRKKNIFIGFLPEENIPLNTQLKEILISFENFYDDSGFLIGASSLKKVTQLEQGLREAYEALGNTTSKCPTKIYSSLGFLRLLTDQDGNFKNEYYYELLETYITPLVKSDTQKDSDHLHTIITYLKNNQAIKLTADELFIHKNTLRARLKKIFSMLEVDSLNSDDMLNLHLAIKIYESTKIVK